MRTVLLSDHPDDMLADEVGKRERSVRGQESAVTAAVRDRDDARAQGRWLRWVRLTFKARRERRELARLRVFAEVPTQRESSIRAGRDAERRVAADLARALDDGWVLFRGYRNRRGEIDGLLLGPGGLLAYEVKYHNGTVYISGDDWQSEKFDKYGNLVRARAPMEGNRSPSRQLNEPASALADWLRKRDHPVPITSVVLLTHDRSRIAGLKDPTVTVVTSTADLIRLAEGSPAKLGAGRRAAIEKIIREDHRHHEQRARSLRSSGR